MPQPGGVDRHPPEIEPVLARRALHAQHAVRRPVAHVEVVGDDAGARRQLAEQLGTQLEVHVVAQIERHDRGAGQVGREEILPEKGRALGDPGGARGVAAGPDQAGIDLDADAAGPEVAGGGDHDPSVAAAQIEDDVPRSHRGHPEHLEADGLRRADEEDVGARKALAQPGAAGQRDQRDRDAGAARAHSATGGGGPDPPPVQVKAWRPSAGGSATGPPSTASRA